MPDEPITTRRRSGAVIEDWRTDWEREHTVGFIVGTDSFLSNWGRARNRSLFAIPIFDTDSYQQRRVILGNMQDRGDMKRVREVAPDYPRKVKLYNGDHLSIRSRHENDVYTIPGYFAARRVNF